MPATVRMTAAKAHAEDTAAYIAAATDRIHPFESAVVAYEKSMKLFFILNRYCKSWASIFTFLLELIVLQAVVKL